MLDKCKRIHVIFDQIIPDMILNAKENEIPGIKDASIDYLPKLEQKAYELASICIKDDRCDNECTRCQPEQIGELFDNARKEIKYK